MKNKNEKSSQSWLPFKQILENGIIETPKKYLKIIKVMPINYELKTILEKEAILNSYKIFLKTCEFDIQILIKSRSENINKYIEKMKEEQNNNFNLNLKKYYQEYFNYLVQLNQNNNSSSKDFYIIIGENINYELADFNRLNLGIMNLNEKQAKIKESLSRCGNVCIDIKNKDEIIDLLYSFFNTRKDFLEKNLKELE